MGDLFSLIYMDSESVGFLKFLHTALRKVISVDHALFPGEVQASQVLLDLLEGWMPLGVGEGSFQIDVQDCGRLKIWIRKESIRVATASPGSRCYRDVFWAFRHPRIQWGLLCRRPLDEIGNILNLAAVPRTNPKQVTRVTIRWRQTVPALPSPSLHWQALRERAFQRGEQPPRACHWLPAFTNQNTETNHA